MVVNIHNVRTLRSTTLHFECKSIAHYEGSKYLGDSECHFPNTPVSQTMGDYDSFFANQPAAVPAGFTQGFRYEQNETLAKLEALDSKEIKAKTELAEEVNQIKKPVPESVAVTAGDIEDDAQETLGYGLAGLAVIVAYLLSSAQ